MVFACILTFATRVFCAHCVDVLIGHAILFPLPIGADFSVNQTATQTKQGGAQQQQQQQTRVEQHH